MTDIRADDNALDNEDRLPWLEAVEEDDSKEGPGAAKLVAFVIIGLVAIGLIVGGLFWAGNRDAGTAGPGGEPELIAAPEGDYKVKPDEPGGMKVEGEGDSAFAASEGADTKGAINVDAVSEAPVAAQPKQQQPAARQAPSQQAPAQQPTQVAAAPKQAPAPAAPAPKPAAPTAAGGATVQLGAFSSQASANNAWKAMSGRFKYLSPLTHNVMSAQVGGKTLYRLRASGPGAKDLCGRLRVAGESCVVID
ncbi:MAG TPA: SPOR domain-containing protein [Allosphingosinicella sp.]|nr:SPOR domain-containing protein [Allosphingosinicella sp.]